MSAQTAASLNHISYEEYIAAYGFPDASSADELCKLCGIDQIVS